MATEEMHTQQQENNNMEGSQSNGEPLHDISDAGLEVLLKILRKDIPSNLYVIGMVENVIRWRRNKCTPLYHLIYAPFGELKNDGAGISVFHIPEISYRVVSFFSQDKHGSKMVDAVIKTKLIDWHEKDNFTRLYAVTREMEPNVHELASKQNLEILFYYMSEVFWMDQEQARNLKVECPPDVKLEKLTSKHVNFIDANWPHRFDGCEVYLRTLIERNFSLGVFPTSAEDPIAWGLVIESSAIALIFTLPNHRRKGYGQILCIAIAQELGKMGINPHAMVVNENLASKKMFKALGFKSGGYNYHVGFKPKTK